MLKDLKSNINDVILIVDQLSCCCHGYFLEGGYNIVMNKSLVSKIRKRKSLTQENLAERSYVTVRTIQRIEAGEEVSSETLKSISNALGVTISELFESVESTEKEIELMEYSKEQKRQFNQRRHETHALRILVFGFVFLFLALFGLFINGVEGIEQSIYGILWVFFLFISLGSIHYFIKVFFSKKLDKKYPMTIGMIDEKFHEKKPIENVWQLIAKRWWIIFLIGGFLSWLIPHLIGR